MDSELEGQAGLPVHACFEVKKSLGTAPCLESAFFFSVSTLKSQLLVLAASAT